MSLTAIMIEDENRQRESTTPTPESGLSAGRDAGASGSASAPGDLLRQTADLACKNLRTLAAYVEDHRFELDPASVDAALERIDAMRNQVAISRQMMPEHRRVSTK